MVLRLLQKEIPSIHGAAFLIGAAGLLSRILGVVRDRLLAAHFGASRALDVYYASFQIPDLLFTVFLIGAASAAIIPLFLQYDKENPQKAQLLIGGLLTLFSLGAAVVALLAFFAAPLLVRFIAPGFSAAEHDVMQQMTRIMMLSPIFLGVSNILSSVMQAKRQFIAFALTGIVYNIGIIAGVVFLVPFFGFIGLAAGVVLGAFLHMTIQIPVLIKIRFWPLFRGWSQMPGLKSVFALSLPRVFALSINQLIVIVLVSLGSFLSAGSIAIFQFSNNLRYLPIGIIGVSYAIAVFPRLTSAALKNSKEVFYEDISAMVETILFWIIPLAFFTVVLRAYIVRAALGAGYFNWDDTRLTAAVLAILAIAMIGECLTPLFIRAFYALGNTKLPFLVSLMTASVVISSAPFLLSLFVRHRLSGRFMAGLLKVGDLPGAPVLGLAMALALGTLIESILLGVGLTFHMKKFFQGSVKNGLSLAIFRIILAAGISSIFCYGVLNFVSAWVSDSHLWGVLVRVLVPFIVSALLYCWMMYIMGSEEVRSVIATFRQKLFRGAMPPTTLDQQGDSSVR